MNSRERLLAVFQRQEPDRIPWAPLIDDYFTSSLPTPMSWVEAYRHIGADVLERHVPAIRSSCSAAVSVEEKRVEDTILTTITTPVGVLTEKRKVTPTTTFIAEPKIKTEKDFGPYKYVVEHTEYERDYETFLERRADIGEDGLATVSGPQSPLQFLIGEDMGLEAIVDALYDCRSELEELLEVMHHKYKQAYALLAESPALVIIGYEDVSTTTSSPQMYREYTMGYLDDYADIVHERGKMYIAHMCGKLKGLASLIAEGRMDGIDSVTPPTTGDIYVDEAREIWGEDKIIIGGLEPKSLRFMGVGEVKEYTKQILSRAAPGRNVILGTGDATSYGTPIENLQAVTEVVKHYGDYPLSVEETE